MGPKLGQFWQCQKWQQCQHRNHGDVLKQQHREAGLPAVAAHQAFLVEGLQDDGGRGQRQHQTDRNRDGQGLAQNQRRKRHDGRCAADLKPAKAQ